MLFRSLTTRGVHTHYDEFLTFRFIATNAPPHTFSWLDAARTNREYGSALVRLSARIEKTWP